MKPVQISDPASEELTKAIQWYEQRRGGLGGELFDAVNHTIDLIREHPEIGASGTGRLPSRQLRVQGFPYKVAYRIREHDIYVVAIAHTKRRPAIGSTVPNRVQPKPVLSRKRTFALLAAAAVRWPSETDQRFRIGSPHVMR